MNARERRNRSRAGKRAAWARSQQITTRDAMRPVTGGRGRVSYQGSGADGYRSDWSRAAHVSGQIKPVVIDRRWSSTVSQQG